MENQEEGKMVVNKRIIVYNNPPLPPTFWHEWNEVCSKLNNYFEIQKMKRDEKQKRVKPRYKDSHSVVY